MSKPNAIYLQSEASFDKIYGRDERDAIASLVNIRDEPCDASDASLDAELAEVEVVFTGWGAPVFDVALLMRMPKLKAIFYGAGSVKGIITPAVWERDILVTSAYVANGRPVAEFTFAQVILALKRAWQQASHLRETQRWERDGDPKGAYYGTKVGVISLGAIGRMVCERLRTLDVEIYAYDPFISDEDMRKHGVHKASLSELFSICDVVTLHTPKLDETLGMIKGAHFRSMPEAATFINTSRGAVVNEPEMVEVLKERPDLFAILDVTDPEPPPPESPMWTLPNVILTPHIAGSMGRECRRMGRLAMEECRRYLRDEPPLHPITEENFARLA